MIVGLLFAAYSCGPNGADNDEQEPDNQHSDDCRAATVSDWQTGLDDLNSGALMSVWGPSEDEVYAVGGQPDEGSLYRFDGQDWQSLDLESGPMLHWVHGDEDRLWMVGDQGRILRKQDGDIEDFDAGIDDEIWGVWSAGEDKVWAVGGDARDFDGSPVILFFDGQEWSEQDLPEIDRDSNALFKIWGTAEDHVFAVGALGLILYFDGEDWEQVASGTGEDFVSLWGRSEDDIVAVGGRSNAVVARFDGESWQSETLGGTPGLNGVWMDCTGTSHINGIDGYAFYLEPNSFEPNVESTPTSMVLHSTFGIDGGPRFGVGGTLNSSPPYRGVAIDSGTP